ncbi:AAA family ATPase [Stenotrophomonas maltophilia]|uniref:AAA family ATPase n=1 Tax=Stenotrophomonas maltophilia TaxID=40324 RepID=UPI000C157864|nr:AAA family ATPase [Stenotrophomonas maltophilia]
MGRINARIEAKDFRLGAEYSRQNVAQVAGLPVPAEIYGTAWADGILELENAVLLFVTLEKEGEASYLDVFDGTDFYWESQNRNSQSSPIIRRMSGGSPTYLFARIRAKARGASNAVPFVYCGKLDFVAMDGEHPVTCLFDAVDIEPGHGGSLAEILQWRPSASSTEFSARQLRLKKGGNVLPPAVASSFAVPTPSMANGPLIWEVVLTDGAIRNGYISVDPNWSGFDAAMLGRPDVASGREATFTFPDGYQITSDLRANGPGSARIRARIAPAFRRLGVAAGDSLLIIQETIGQYRVEARKGSRDTFELGYVRLRERFLAQFPGFTGFSKDQRLLRETIYKRQLVEHYKSLLLPALDAGGPKGVWSALIKLLRVRVGAENPQPQNVVGWRIVAQLAELSGIDQLRLGKAVLSMLRAEPVSTGLEAFNRGTSKLSSPLQPAAQRSLSSLLLTLEDSKHYFFVKTGQIRRALEMLDPTFDFRKGGMTGEEWERIRALADRLAVRLSEDGWRPADMIDVQSFLWVAIAYEQGDGADAEEEDEAEAEDEAVEQDDDMPVIHAPTNTILYGPPGTGKTYGVVDKALEILDPELLAATKGQGTGARAALKQRFDALHEEGRIRFVTFHQSFAYEDFVEGLKARAGASGALEYGVENGVFLELCIDAQHSDLPYVLIVDEINRGNIARIFGELITLIEPSKRQGMHEALSVRLPYSKQDFAVPANLHIIGTMNTADRSLAAMDVALRRRFRFIEMPPQPELLDWDVDGIRMGELLSTLNSRIEVLLGRDHLIGHAYLMGAKDLPGLAEAFRLRILPLLQEYFFEDWRRIAWVLNDDAKPQGERFLRRRELQLNRLFAPEAQLAPDTANWYIHEAAFEQAASYRGILVGQAD